MALIECPECGNGVSDLAESCPQCAYPLAELAISQTPVGEVHTIESKPSSTRQSHRMWVVLLIIATMLISPYAPMLPMSFGILLLLLCVTTFIPVVQDYSFRLLRLNKNKMLRSGLRVTMYGSIGLVLILMSLPNFERKAQEIAYKVAQEKVVVKKSAEKNKKRKLTRKANSQVAASVKKAEEAWQNDNSVLAEQILELASKTTDASDMESIRELRTRMANAKVKTLIEDAKSEINNRYIGLAKDKVQAALTLPHADALADAHKLNEQISDATDSTRIRTILMYLSDDDFQKFQEGGDLPKRLVTGYEPLDNNALEMAKSQITVVADAREKRKQEQLERERIATEVARKAEEERKARQLAVAEEKRRADKQRQEEEKTQREAAQKQIRDRLDAYVALLNAAEVKLIKNVSVDRIGKKSWKATLTVDNLWHIRHYQIRLQDAQTLWEAWASIASPMDPDKARIKLVDLRENEVGGSRVWGGSLIWVNED